MKASNWFEACGIVAWPLLAFSIVGLAMIAERLWFWFRVNRRQKRVVREVLRLYQHDSDVAIRKLQQNADLPIARIFLEALELNHPSPEKFRIALESAAQAEIPTLKRFSTAFDTIISLSPLLGLLGTVLGLITSFAALNIGDVGGTKTAGVTAGISEALVSTASGLVVAIFTLMFANTFRGFYLRQIALIQEYGGQIELLYLDRYEQGEVSHASTR
ncbi:MotA/TolQ/ExbB proton channel family protein [Allocoleopsis sp.]|uniref:MotA/TolQ/ExbB proton channel family protein n=1 Tax=Allocoleopsis sp. TaxID=3088169 RepID=UPI002FD52302